MIQRVMIAIIALMLLAVLALYAAPYLVSGQTIPPPVFAPLVADGHPVPCGCWADLYNCSDFATRADAQACFDYCLTWTGLDTHRLDANNDGVACESLPPGWVVWTRN